MSGRFRKEGQMLPKRDFYVAAFRLFLKKETELFDKMYVQNSREGSCSFFHAPARFLGRGGVQPFDKNAQKVFPNVFLSGILKTDFGKAGKPWETRSENWGAFEPG